jgi:hypothetical protein
MILYLLPLAYPLSLIMSCLLLYEFIVTCVCAHWLLKFFLLIMSWIFVSVSFVSFFINYILITLNLISRMSFRLLKALCGMMNQ